MPRTLLKFIALSIFLYLCLLACYPAKPRETFHEKRSSLCDGACNSDGQEQLKQQPKDKEILVEWSAMDEATVEGTLQESCENDKISSLDYPYLEAFQAKEFLISDGVDTIQIIVRLRMPNGCLYKPQSSSPLYVKTSLGALLQSDKEGPLKNSTLPRYNEWKQVEMVKGESQFFLRSSLEEGLAVVSILYDSVFTTSLQLRVPIRTK